MLLAAQLSEYGIPVKIAAAEGFVKQAAVSSALAGLGFDTEGIIKTLEGEDS